MLNLKIQNLGDVTVFRCAGRITADDADGLRKAVLAQSQLRVAVLDLAEISAVDAAGLGMLAGLRNWAKSAGKQLLFTDFHPQMHNVGLPNLDYVLDWGENEYGHRVTTAGYKAFVDQHAVMKHNIRSTHVHDNAAERDNHLWLGEGTIDWSECAALLRTAPHTPPVLLEIEGENQPDINGGIAKAFAHFDKAMNTKPAAH